MSIINNIALSLISKKDTPKANKQFLNWSQVSTILIIAYDNQLADIVEFINTCKKDNITVKVGIIYNGKPEHAPKPHFEHFIVDKKQFNFFGIPSDAGLQRLHPGSVDVLINLGAPEQIKSLALSKLITAKCKISSFQHDIFDISIDSDKTLHISNYLKQVVVYLNMIKPIQK
ncbi:MAG: hypothetical protein V4506_15215 [Bacteroidota bacterium]